MVYFKRPLCSRYGKKLHAKGFFRGHCLAIVEKTKRWHGIEFDLQNTHRAFTETGLIFSVIFPDLEYQFSLIIALLSLTCSSENLVGHEDNISESIFVIVLAKILPISLFTTPFVNQILILET